MLSCGPPIAQIRGDQERRVPAPLGAHYSPRVLPCSSGTLQASSWSVTPHTRLAGVSQGPEAPAPLRRLAEDEGSASAQSPLPYSLAPEESECLGSTPKPPSWVWNAVFPAPLTEQCRSVASRSYLRRFECGDRRGMSGALRSALSVPRRLPHRVPSRRRAKA